MTGFMPGSLIRPAPLEIPGCMMFSGISGKSFAPPSSSSTAVEGCRVGEMTVVRLTRIPGSKPSCRRVDCPQNRKQTPENRAFWVIFIAYVIFAAWMLASYSARMRIGLSLLTFGMVTLPAHWATSSHTSSSRGFFSCSSLGSPHQFSTPYCLMSFDR